MRDENQRKFFELMEETYAEVEGIIIHEASRSGWREFPSPHLLTFLGGDQRDIKLEDGNSPARLFWTMCTLAPVARRQLLPPYAIAMEPWHRLDRFCSEQGFKLISDRELISVEVENKQVPFYKAEWEEYSMIGQRLRVQCFATWWCDGRWGPLDETCVKVDPNEGKHMDVPLKFIRLDVSFRSNAERDINFTSVFDDLMFRIIPAFELAAVKLGTKTN
jgi:hypothetical protein